MTTTTKIMVAVSIICLAILMVTIPLGANPYLVLISGIAAGFNFGFAYLERDTHRG